MEARKTRVRGVALGLVLLLACATDPDPLRYRLTGSGSHWDVAGNDHVLDDVVPRYRELFDVVLDPAKTQDLDLRALRDDLERSPVDRRNYDALNAVAIAYFELNYRAQRLRGGTQYLSNSFRAAKLLAVPWRAYGEIEEGALRHAILDFFTDAASGEKLESGTTAGRLARIVESLQSKESDPARLERIEALAQHIAATYPLGP